MLISSGYVCAVDHERCIGCGLCIEQCPFGALSLVDGHASVSEDACMGCGVCREQCAQDALSLVLDATRPAPLEINALMAAALDKEIESANAA